MSELRWIILGIGIVVIAAVYFFSRRKKNDARQKQPAQRQQANTEPYLGGFEQAPADDGVAFEAPPHNAPASMQAPAASADEQLILTLHVISRSSDGFAADDVATTLAAAGLRFGRYGIYHFTGDDDADWFSAANMVEPGRFPAPDSTETAPGITLFMMMPGLAEPQQALDALLAAARRLAADLDGELADHRRKPFTAQAAQRMREQLAEFHARHVAEKIAPLPSGEGLG